MDFRDHLFTPPPIEELNENVFDAFKRKPIEKPKQRISTYDSSLDGSIFDPFKKAYKNNSHNTSKQEWESGSPWRNAPSHTGNVFDAFRRR